MEQLSPELITEILKAVSPKSMLKLCDVATAPNSWKAIASHEHYRRSELNLAISVRPTYKRQTRFLFTKRIRGTDDFNESLTHLEVLQKYPEKSLSRVDIVDTDEMQSSLIPGVSATSDKWTRVNLNAKSEIFNLLRKNGVEKLLMDVRNETSLKAIRSLYEMFLSHGALVREFYLVVKFNREADLLDALMDQREIDFFEAMTRLPNVKDVSYFLGLSSRMVEMLRNLVLQTKFTSLTCLCCGTLSVALILEFYEKWERNPEVYKNFALKARVPLHRADPFPFDKFFPNPIPTTGDVISRQSIESASGARMVHSIINYSKAYDFYESYMMSGRPYVESFAMHLFECK